jgi:adenylate cyclase class 2
MEIEIKARVSDMPELRARLEGAGCTFAPPVVQDDTVYVRKTGSLHDFLSNDAFLRIRVQNDGRIIFTAKKNANKSGHGLVKTEHEVTVSSVEELRGILQLSGHIPAVHVRKSRLKAHHGRYEICLDEIDGLGSFIELEEIGEESTAPMIQKNMWDFLESLGVSREDEVTKGYDILMLEASEKTAHRQS